MIILHFVCVALSAATFCLSIVCFSLLRRVSRIERVFRQASERLGASAYE